MKKPKLNRWVSLSLLLLFVVALYVSLNKLFVPFIEQVASSSLFLKETENDDPLGDVRNERTDVAALHCENSIRDDEDISPVSTASDTDYKAWSLGDFTYVIKAQSTGTPEGGDPAHYRYACKIHWNGQDMADPGNWSIQGMDLNKG